MKLCCSSPMVPGATLTAKADLLKTWGYDGIAVFQPLETWNAETHRELLELEARTGVKPVEFVLADAYDLPRFGRPLNGGFTGFWLSHVPRSRLRWFFEHLHEALELLEVPGM